ncbi:NUDIX hydrolase [Schaalia vaccimaxillae]|uniref:NUDIX hydrolase n=1 Tax=Schaalia vaccimaxillae TaxID=183916 RepID=UPI0003B4E7D6|nr:NUDIX domain-containing protein [Schaalia vaccimaxillae]
MSGLGPEWPIDEDGYPHREAARVVLFNEDGDILLARGHDRDQPERHWWFTIGGGMEPGESPRQAAVRELFEETGIAISADSLIGPVLHRSAIFDFLSVTAKQDEWFFIGYVRSQESLDDTGWTDLERDVIDEQKWWDLDELEASSANQEVYPRDLVSMVRWWRSGWDGQMLWISEGEN